jgi:hypothetical protein
LRRDVRGAIVCVVDEPVIYRDEVIALPFAVYDISETLLAIEILVGGDDGE